MKYAASLANQITFIVAQALVLACLYRAEGMHALDEVFLALALATPIYVFLLLGGRQLYASDIISFPSFLKLRIFCVSLFVALAGAVWWQFGRDLSSLNMLFLVVSWKAYDMTQDIVGILLQKAGAVASLIAVSLARVVVILPALFVPSALSIKLLIITFAALAFSTWMVLFWRVRGQNSAITISVVRKGVALGIAAAASALTVAGPRILLGKVMGVGSGAVAFIGVASYVYLIGQVVISALAPHAIAGVLRIELSERRVALRKLLRIASVFFFGVILPVVAIYYVAAERSAYLEENKVIFLLLLSFVFIGLVGNTAEAFVSAVGGERTAAKAAITALIVSIVLAFPLINHFGAYGYCLSLLAAFLARFMLLRLEFGRRELPQTRGLNA